MALVALVAIGPKYGKRQSALERNYQARERVSEPSVAGNTSAADSRTNGLAAERAYATANDTLVPLWPLAMVLCAVVLFAIYMLRRVQMSPRKARHDELAR